MFEIYFAVISILLVATILLQQKNSSLGSLMGQDSGDEIAQTRRGSELFLHKATIFLAALFVLGGIFAMMS